MTCDCTKEDYKGRWMKTWLYNRRVYFATCPKQGCFQFGFKRLVDPSDRDADKFELGAKSRDRIVVHKMGLSKDAAIALGDAIFHSYPGEFTLDCPPVQVQNKTNHEETNH